MESGIRGGLDVLWEPVSLELQIANEAANLVEKSFVKWLRIGKSKDWDSFLILGQSINFCSHSNLTVRNVHVIKKGWKCAKDMSA